MPYDAVQTKKQAGLSRPGVSRGDRQRAMSLFEERGSFVALSSMRDVADVTATARAASSTERQSTGRLRASARWRTWSRVV
jgi:hypothetical protein